MSRIFNFILFFLRTGVTERRLTRLYATLARLDYRDWKAFSLPNGERFLIKTMNGGPRILVISSGYEFLMKYNTAKDELYIQEPYTEDIDGWRVVYRTRKFFIRGPWLEILKHLIRHNPCVPNREEGFL